MKDPKDKLCHHLTNPGTVLVGGSYEVHVSESSFDVVKAKDSGIQKVVVEGCGV